MNKKNVLITGSNGFIGSNLRIKLIEKGYNVETFTKKNTVNQLNEKIKKTDFIFHLAGVNRSKIKKKFKIANIDLTKKICEILSKEKKKNSNFFFIKY